MRHSASLLRVATVPTTETPVVAPKSEEQQQQQPLPRLGELARFLPKDAFQVDTITSLKYFGFDLAAVVTSMTALHAVVVSNFYHQQPIHLQALMVGPLQVMTGFSLWCMWCIGHDAGHSLVSKQYPLINEIIGEVAHSVVCLTPFVPWQLSHRRHHLNHNHLTKDYSHQWFIREEQETLDWWIQWSYQTRNLQLPLLYLVYLLLGIPDGGHVFFYGRLWEGQPAGTQARAALSVVISLATAGSLWASLGTADFLVVCMMPWLVLSFWLFMVTYLQHHSDDGKLYTDDTWDFVRGAFETVDRSYGKWTNRLSHHMMDGHVVHHLFFERVPHYRLEEATVALREGLEATGRSHLYKRVDTPDYTQEIVRQFNENWFFVNERQVQRK